MVTATTGESFEGEKKKVPEVPGAAAARLPGGWELLRRRSEGSRTLWGPGDVPQPASSLLRCYPTLIKQTAHKEGNSTRLASKNNGAD